MPQQARQIGLLRVQRKVKVIGYQAAGGHICVEAIRCLRDDFELFHPIQVVAVNRIAPVATRCDWLDGARKLKIYCLISVDKICTVGDPNCGDDEV